MRAILAAEPVGPLVASRGKEKYRRVTNDNFDDDGKEGGKRL